MRRQRVCDDRDRRRRLLRLRSLQRRSRSRAGCTAAPAEIAAPAIPGVIAPGHEDRARQGRLSAGTEGPVAMPDGGIVFTNNNFLTRLDAAGNATRRSSRCRTAPMGLASIRRAGLIAVERKPMDERVGVLYPPDAVTTLADKADGKPFEALNDLVVSSRDAVYFTDHNGVYYLPAGGGTVTKVAEGIPNPNGVQLSPDERTLYANNKDGEYLLAFDVKADGTLANRRNFAKHTRASRRRTARTRCWPKTTAPTALPSTTTDACMSRPTSAWKCSVRRATRSASFPPIWGGDVFMLKQAAEPRVLGTRQEDALHGRRRRGVQGPDADAGRQQAIQMKNDPVFRAAAVSRRGIRQRHHRRVGHREGAAEARSSRR